MALTDFDLIIFDLDGTLVDSREDIVVAFNQGLSAVGAAPASTEQVMPLIGTPLKTMYEQLLPARDHDVVEAACRGYRAYYLEHCADASRPFPGVEESLKQLGPTPLAVATTKMTYMAVEVLERLGLAEHFALIQGTDGIPPKPDPTILNKVAAHFGVANDRCWMVGDTLHDLHAAKAAGMKRCAVTYGFTDREVLAEAAPEVIVDDLREFVTHCRNEP